MNHYGSYCCLWKWGQEKASLGSRKGMTSRDNVKGGSGSVIARCKWDILPALHKLVLSIGALWKEMCLMAWGPKKFTSDHLPVTEGQRCDYICVTARNSWSHKHSLAHRAFSRIHNT